VPEVSVVVELRVEIDGGRPDPVALERAVAAEGRRAARELYREVLTVLDRAATEASGGARQRLEERWMATVFGRVRIRRYRVKGPGRSFHPLDRVLGLSQAEPTPALREAICDLATRVPYRQVGEVCSRLVGEPISAQTCWRVVQEEGARIRTEEGELAGAVFELGEAPPEVGLAPELVVVEEGGTYLRAQREEGDRFEVRTGVFYTGEERAGGRRHRRLRLLEKGCYATTASADAFGKGLAARGFSWVGLHRARFILCLHDGLEGYGQGFRGLVPRCHPRDPTTSTWPSGSGRSPGPIGPGSRSSSASPPPTRRPARSGSGAPGSSAPSTRRRSPPTSRGWPGTSTGWTGSPAASAGAGCGWWARPWSRSTRTSSWPGG
jgi:hypothetical protein